MKEKRLLYLMFYLTGINLQKNNAKDRYKLGFCQPDMYFGKDSPN